jgi:hypothetical protein
MPEKGSVRKAISDLVAANRIVANEGVLNGFGHVSIRHPAPVAFDDRSLKGLAPQLRYLEIDVAASGLQRPLVTASPGILPSLAALVTSGSTKLVSLSFQHCVQRLFNSPTNHLAEMVSNPGFIDLDYLAHRLLIAHR